MPISRQASSPAVRHSPSTCSTLRRWTSSIRVGWTRPSASSSSRATRATSRRTGSKQLRTTASGVSSMTRFTPVICSKARMLRPSRPMIRPFRSSLARWTTDTVRSALCSEASRWMAVLSTRLASDSALRRASVSMSRARVAALSRASCSAVASTSARASSTLRRATRSRSAARSAAAPATSAACSSRRRRSSSSRASRSASRCSRRSMSSRCSCRSRCSSASRRAASWRDTTRTATHASSTTTTAPPSIQTSVDDSSSGVVARRGQRAGMILRG